jgi:hypothetical protein
VDWVSGAAIVIRRQLLDDIGLLDERFFMYCEDVDLGFRAKQKGWRVVYYPGAVVTHAIGKSSDHDPNRMIAEFHKSMYRFFRKHYARRTSILAHIVVPVGLFIRASAFITRNQYQHYRYLLLNRLRRRSRNRADRKTTLKGQSEEQSRES